MSHKCVGLLLLITTFLAQGFCDECQSKPVQHRCESPRCECQSKPVQPQPSCSYGIRPQIEVKFGYFFFSEEKMRKVYDDGGIDVQIAGSYPMWKWLQIYASLEVLQRHGRSLRGHQRAAIWEFPLSLGPKFVARIRSWSQYYLTIGPRYFFVHVHTHSRNMDKYLNQNGCGGFVGTGFNFFPTKHLLIDIFGEYSYCRLHFHPHKKNTFGESAQVGGFTFGAGIGYAF